MTTPRDCIKHPCNLCSHQDIKTGIKRDGVAMMREGGAGSRVGTTFTFADYGLDPAHVDLFQVNMILDKQMQIKYG